MSRPLVSLAPLLCTHLLTVLATVAPAAAPVTFSNTMVPSSGALWGTWTRPDYSAGQTWGQAATSLETKLGREFDILHNYHQWTDTFPNTEETTRARGGQILYLNVKPPAAPSWANVAAGLEDARIDIIANRLKAIAPAKVFFTVHHEPEDEVGSYGSIADYANMYRHIHDRFEAKGVTNVVYVWNVMGFSGHYSKYTSGLYPGDDYVDWIAYDPYNWFEKSGTWVSFKDTVKPFYDWLKANGHGDKPFMLGEFGAPDDPANPTRQADWYQSIPSDLATSFPNLKALVYFNSTTWTYDDTPASLSAFKTISANSYVNVLPEPSAAAAFGVLAAGVLLRRTRP